MADRMLATHDATAAGAVALTVFSEQQVNMLMARPDDDRDDALSQAEVEADEATSRRAGRGLRDGPEGGPRH